MVLLYWFDWTLCCCYGTGTDVLVLGFGLLADQWLGYSWNRFLEYIPYLSQLNNDRLKRKLWFCGSLCLLVCGHNDGNGNSWLLPQQQQPNSNF